MMIDPDITCTVEPDSEALALPVTVGVLSEVKLFWLGLVIVPALGLVASTLRMTVFEPLLSVPLSSFARSV